MGDQNFVEGEIKLAKQNIKEELAKKAGAIKGEQPKEHAQISEPKKQVQISESEKQAQIQGAEKQMQMVVSSNL